MNDGMLVMGLVFAGIGGYVLRNTEKELERGLSLWMRFDTSKIDLEEHPRAIQRQRYGGLLFVMLGILTFVWGVLDWSDRLHVGILIVIAILGSIIVHVETSPL